jgi:hypothetical protein
MSQNFCTCHELRQKNGDKQVWKEKFHVAKWEGLACTHEWSKFFLFECAR